MKKSFPLLIIASSLVACTATRNTTPVVVAPPVVTDTTPLLQNLDDSASYAIGLSVANFYRQQGMHQLNVQVIAQAITDVLDSNTILISDKEANDVMMRYMNLAQESKAKPNIEAGEKFLAENKTKPGVQVTASGIQYEVITQGKGPKPAATDQVTVHYIGTLIDGTEFDNSYKRGQPASFALNGVIKGWTEALQLMPEGSKYKIYIPQELGYGKNEVGTIPAGSVLIFEVELIKVAQPGGE
jgi:FKBP-type peptidyl-prolyl cis-trans isomerase FklB